MANSNYGVNGYGQGGYGNGPVSYLFPEYYLSLVTQQYAGSEQFLSFLRGVVSIFTDIAFAVQGFDQAFDLDYAIGVQLDAVGALSGAARTLPFQPSNGVSPVLSDTDYRLLLRAKVAANRFNGNIDSLQTLYKSLFPGGTIIINDNHNMSANIVLTGAFTSLQKDMILNGLILPNPQGVLFNYSFATLPLLGFDFNNGFIAGVDTGHAI